MAAMMFMMSRSSGNAGAHNQHGGRREPGTSASEDEILVSPPDPERIR